MVAGFPCCAFHIWPPCAGTKVFVPGIGGEASAIAEFGMEAIVEAVVRGVDHTAPAGTEVNGDSSGTPVACWAKSVGSSKGMAWVSGATPLKSVAIKGSIIRYTQSRIPFFQEEPDF